MVTSEHKAQKEALPEFFNKLKSKEYVTLEIQRLKQLIIEQLEESMINVLFLKQELDENQNDILDIVEKDEGLKYIFQGLPAIDNIKHVITRMNRYYYLSERQNKKLLEALIIALDYADTTREVIKLIPVDATRLSEQDVERFKSIIKGLLIAYRDEKTKIGKGALIEDIKSKANTEEKIVWVNSIAIEILGEELLKGGA